MSEWKTYKLGEVATKIGSGATPRGGKEAYLDKGEYSLVRSQNVLDFSFSKSGLAFISEEQANGLKNVELEVNDILLNITGDSVARVCQVPNDILPARVNQHVAIIRGKSEILDQQFLKYYLLQPSFKKYMLGLASAGATRNALTKSMIESFEIHAPNIETQTQIAQILSSLDDKIELNLQMNQTLEAMAQAIFKEWFVDFNFPGSEKPKVKNEKSSQSKNPENQGADNLPKGWRVIELSKLISVKDGTHDSPKPTENGKFLITSKHLKNHFIDFESAYRISEDDFEKINKRSKVDKLDVLITMIGTVGNLYFVHDEIIDFAIKNIGLFKISENPDLAYFLYFTISSKRISDYFTKRLAGSTQQYLTLETLRLTPILLPDDKTLKLFNDFAKSIYQKIETNRRNIQTLTQTRDTLLPKLMSGKIELV